LAHSHQILGCKDSSRWRFAGASPAALLIAALCAPAALAQPGSASEILGAAPSLAQQCNGPLGSLLPECQAGKNPISISAPGILGGGGSASTHVTSGNAAGPEHEVSSPGTLVEPSSEFQRFVASSVGKLLPIFGANLFEKVPTTFAPLDRVPVPAEYVVGPGDELLLRVWGQVSLDMALTVDRAGSVFVPQAGSVRVAGLPYKELSGFLRVQLARVFRNFDLTVNLGQLRSIQIFVVGQARRPGTYTVSSLSTLVNALFASGGPSAQGSMRHIQLKRGAQVVADLDLYGLLLKGDKSQDVQLLPGDVVYIPAGGPQVAVAGSVKNPAIYEFSVEKTVGDLIQMAGGLSALADAQRATIERIRDRSSRESLELRLDAAGLRTPAQDGDVLNILTIAPRFDNAVTLRGNVANPGRFPWHAGMRLREMIPDKESLVTRDYWRKRNLLGFTPPEEAVPGEPRAEAQKKPEQTRVQMAAPDINWAYAVIERQNPRDLTTELVPFHPGKLVLENDDTENLELRRGDVVTIFSQADVHVAMLQQSRFVRLEGEFDSAGVYAVKPGETLGQLIQRAGGLTPKAYLFGAEFVRESTRADEQRRLDQFIEEMQANLDHAASNQFTKASGTEDSAAMAAQIETARSTVARLRAVKATGRIVLNLEPESNDISKLMDFELEDGDRFLVPARPATVNVLGAVYSPNALLYQPNLRLADYLRQAGGPTRNADKGRIFVIRADGASLPKQGFSPFSRTFESESLNPGDSIVVPESILTTGFWRGLRDWTQVLAQFGLAAAAVNVLR